MKTTAIATAAALLATALLSGCSSTDSGDEIEIEILDDEFEGGNRHLAAGTEVEFDNEGSHVHTVTIHKQGEPESTLRLDEELNHEEKAYYTFSEKGTYHVWCKIHGTMTQGMAIVITVE